MKGEVLAKVQIEGFSHVRFLRRVTRHKPCRYAGRMSSSSQIWSAATGLAPLPDSVTSLTISCFLRV
jgi:hypothetical protein